VASLFQSLDTTELMATPSNKSDVKTLAVEMVANRITGGDKPLPDTAWIRSWPIDEALPKLYPTGSTVWLADRYVGILQTMISFIGGALWATYKIKRYGYRPSPLHGKYLIHPTSFNLCDCFAVCMTRRSLVTDGWMATTIKIWNDGDNSTRDCQ
jgi:hypothetical protein